MLFGDRIKQLRDSAGLTQAELGKLIGVSDRVLGYYEANERFPRKQEVIAKFAEVFKVSIDYLLGSDGSFLQDSGEKYGAIGHMQAQGVLKSVETLFAGGELIEDDKDEVFRIISELYFDAKKKNKEKYGRKKKDK
ncbi:helix-turn-helix domain-containing protein [Clostridium tagluense]|uniref:HTH cro/C1-type domain-containing protein n=1 Tax=Clostridium tagluense TaxID=360422 RepID=A0A401UQ12_9CLOT|nr:MULTISPECIES: helix-turn-helix transcriptional regulator [Clostridium]MBU3128995.1 helix-turn-helix domain-containing protein [Clostridium tagluense]MBW9158802.1 helix-turn-helix domain-containing protein [Clostridium tagluense]MBZ9634657.1 helix-turn-helix domain-containing protein [Clostridium sp. FP1]MCB2312102.1 helix-turn-helix domain-containing protein [Clostridium tagluense]MCB2316713.1 helix-turn-helix domain-containing protein [Clostridium tagluense]